MIDLVNQFGDTDEEEAALVKVERSRRVSFSCIETSLLQVHVVRQDRSAQHHKGECEAALRRLELGRGLDH